MKENYKKGKLKIMRALMDIQEEFGLTEVELGYILSQELNLILKYQVRDENDKDI